MKYISEEKLREIFRSLYWSKGTEEELMNALLEEFQELSELSEDKGEYKDQKKHMRQDILNDIINHLECGYKN